MAFIGMNTLQIYKEYCNKPENKQCPIPKLCYNDEFQCRYWKQIKLPHWKIQELKAKDGE